MYGVKDKFISKLAVASLLVTLHCNLLVPNGNNHLITSPLLKLMLPGSS